MSYVIGFTGGLENIYSCLASGGSQVIFGTLWGAHMSFIHLLLLLILYSLGFADTSAPLEHALVLYFFISNLAHKLKRNA